MSSIVRETALIGLESALKMVKACPTREQAIKVLEEWIKEEKAKIDDAS